jgi:hypothetical protein
MAKETKMVKALREHLESLTPEQIEEIREKYFTDKRPKGWLSIEEHLPMMFAIDIVRGYSVFKVKDKDGNEFESAVADHNIWYYRAKDEGITHWLNE